MYLVKLLKNLLGITELERKLNRLEIELNENKLLSGGELARSNAERSVRTIQDAEFKVFSQFGDDGIIQYLTSIIPVKNEHFIEFGVEDFSESNCRFLMMNNNWSGFVIDGNPENIQKLKKSYYFWKHDLQAVASFITKENINTLLSSFKDVGLLHIDLDGNDYWVLKELELERLNPDILILEYNSVWGEEKKVTIPYDPTFYRTQAHYSNLYWGASLAALKELAQERGYFFLGTNQAGNNAYFSHARHQGLFKDLEVKTCMAKYRESRDENGKLSFLRSGHDKLSLVAKLPLIDLSKNTSRSIDDLYLK